MNGDRGGGGAGRAEALPRFYFEAIVEQRFSQPSFAAYEKMESL